MLDGVLFLFFKQKTAYEMLISDWSSDVCSSDLLHQIDRARLAGGVIGDADHQRGLAVVHRHQHHDTAADALLQLVGQRLQILGREAFHDAGCELQAADLAYLLAVGCRATATRLLAPPLAHLALHALALLAQRRETARQLVARPLLRRRGAAPQPLLGLP